MALSSSLPHLLFLLALTSSVALLAAAAADGQGDDGLTHIHLYVHETSSGPNATYASVLESPLGANSTFGSMGVVDDEIRVGPNRTSQLVGHYQAVFFGTGMQPSVYVSSITLVFTAGEYNGSTLSVQGPVFGFSGTIERIVIGGTGKFRLARGYMLLKVIGKPTPETNVDEINLFVLMHPSVKY